MDLDTAEQFIDMLTGGDYPLLLLSDASGDTVSVGPLVYGAVGAYADEPELLAGSVAALEGKLTRVSLYDVIETVTEPGSVPADITGSDVPGVMSATHRRDKSFDQVLLTVELSRLRLSWFRRPSGHDVPPVAVVSDEPFSHAVDASRPGTVNRMLLELSAALRRTS